MSIYFQCHLSNIRLALSLALAGCFSPNLLASNVLDHLPVDTFYMLGLDSYSTACSGTLYDSGGPAGDYSNSETWLFTLCPDESFQCIFIELASFSMEAGFDRLAIFEGNDTLGQQITQFTAYGNQVQLQNPSTCITFLFQSDGTQTDNGFELNWQCDANPCTTPPPSTCANPIQISSLPYISSGLSTCSMLNNYAEGPCGSAAFWSTDDVIFTYESDGSECIAISITGSNETTGLTLLTGCPSDATATCIAQVGGGLGQTDPSITAAYLPTPGTYYIVVDNAFYCTDFNIEIVQTNCPVVFPAAANCEDALSLKGCGTVPAIVTVGPGQGDSSAIISGVNDGCWGDYEPNFTWFSFQAHADGEFGFLLQASQPDEVSDVDFQVWGPISDEESICSYTTSHQPIRSSYAAGANPTGLAHIHPVTGLPVVDDCEDAFGDDFVTPILTISDAWYVVLVNDWGGQITSGAVSIAFDGTTSGVLDATAVGFGVSNDTFACPGQQVQLWVDGGALYQWFPANGLTCTDCPNPKATVTETTLYQVEVKSICVTDTLQVLVGPAKADAGSDQTVCLGEDIQLSANSNIPDVTWNWSGAASQMLSCLDCQHPIFTGQIQGDAQLIATATGADCSFSDTVQIHVLSAPAPVYSMADNQTICLGDSLYLGGLPIPGVTYHWTSQPGGFSSSEANPLVSPDTATTFYLTTTNTECPLPSLDSIFVNVAEKPLLFLANDTSICAGQSVVLGNTATEPDVAYAWAPISGLDDAMSPNPLATPLDSTVYVLSANRSGCLVKDTVTVLITPAPQIDIQPSFTTICLGDTIQLQVTGDTGLTGFSWTPTEGLSCTDCLAPYASPDTSTTFAVNAVLNGCTGSAAITIEVLTSPAIDFPDQNMLCPGAQILLNETFDMNATYQWTASDGSLDTIDPQPLVTPLQTTTYFLIAVNEGCQIDTSFTVIVGEDFTASIDSVGPLCNGDSAILNAATSVAGLELTWTDIEDNVFGTGDSYHTGSLFDPTQFILIAADTSGCFIKMDTGDVAVYPAFELLVPDIVYATPGEATNLTAEIVPSGLPLTIEWEVGGMLAGTGPTIQVSSCQGESYYVKAFNGLGCAVMDSVFLNAGNGFSIESLNFMHVPHDTFTMLYEGQEIVLSVTTNPPILAGSTFQWFFDGQQVSTTTDTVSAPFLVPELETDQPFAIDVFISQSPNCGQSDSSEILVMNIPVEVPNAFSPNNDGTNDHFFPVSPVPVNLLFFRVWDRWGQLVYDNENGNMGWDGRFKDKEMPSDVYVYSIGYTILKGSNALVHQKKGEVTLLR